MKRTAFKRKTSLKAGGFAAKRSSLKQRTGLVSKGVSLKRSKLRKKGVSATSKLKDQIQAEVRTKVIARDGGCILRGHAEIVGACGGYDKEGRLILQAEHLITRGKNRGFADLKNLVCICYHHHIDYKPHNEETYWKVIRMIIGEEVWSYLESIRTDREIFKAGTYELTQTLHNLKNHD